MKLKSFVVLFSLASLFVVGCKTKKAKFEFVTPQSGVSVAKGQKLVLKLNFPDTTMDSVVYSVDGEPFATRTDTASIVFDTDKFGYGNLDITAKLYANGAEDIAYNNVLVTPPAPKSYGFEVIQDFPHDSLAYTQGLQYVGGKLYESTGQWGRSTLREVDLPSGKVVRSVSLDERYFGEGITIYDGQVVFLTWRENVGFVYDLKSFKQKSSFSYSSSKEGWGITYDGERLIKSDGTSFLYFLNPQTFEETGSIQVFNERGPVDLINELEYIDGKVYANMYYDDRDEVLIINPATGAVEGKINFVGLYSGKRSAGENQMNGIAYNDLTGHLYVTGKEWNKLFEVRIKEL